MLATYKDKPVQLKVDQFNDIIAKTMISGVQEEVAIGKVHEQPNKRDMSRWLAYSLDKKHKTFASTKKKVIQQLINKINQEYAETASFHQGGRTDMRETISRYEAMYMLQSGKAESIGFKKATFCNHEDRLPFEYGWFDLQDKDINLSINQNQTITLELWFNYLYGIDKDYLDERVIEIKEENREVKQVKFKVQITQEDVDYIVHDGTRLMIS